ncbi:hypothetical protein C2G38_816486 [Gigaspora rosea]|uniref:Uncharacterized protein n=1 Tax=Gigaspora rosea TaxID=44941 RepID=A0A397U6Y2_9GLOM|nr:hypothetical protein C2G38_816486 [Gigaspora rosea]
MEFRFVQNLVGTFNGSFEFGDSIDFKTPFVIKLDLPIANDDTTPTNNTKPIPLRYLSKKIEDADPRTLLKIGMIRTDNSLITRKIISFLQEFEMKFNIITPNDIPLCDINVLIFDSAEADNEMIETICRNPLTIVKFWNSLISAAEAIKKRSYNIESITQGEICETDSRQGETNEESREESNLHQGETSEESREGSNPHQGETSEESREESIPHQGEIS